MDYYLYTHSNADGIFYVGKGCGDRAKHNFLSERSAEWHEAAKHGYLTKIEAHGTEECIFSAEKMYIKLLVEQGVNLVNKYHNPSFKRSEEMKQKMLASQKGEKHPMFGKTHSDKTKQKMSDKAKQRPNLSYILRKRWQHTKLKKANNYRRTL